MNMRQSLSTASNIQDKAEGGIYTSAKHIGQCDRAHHHDKTLKQQQAQACDGNRAPGFQQHRRPSQEVTPT
jgi:hypothetical protein